MGGPTSGRTSVITPAIVAEMVKLFEVGVTMTDVCASVNISTTTYYNWRQRGESAKQDYTRLLQSGYDDDDPEATEMQKDIYLQFLEAVTRAQSRANIGAVVAVKSAISGQTETMETTTTVTETRLRKEKRTLKDGTVIVEEVPYEYSKTTKTLTATKIPPDWRAGMEYLRRRQPKEWAGTQTTRDDFFAILVAMVKGGDADYAELEAEIGTDMALEIYKEAGKQVLRLNG